MIPSKRRIAAPSDVPVPPCLHHLGSFPTPFLSQDRGYKADLLAQESCWPSRQQELDRPLTAVETARAGPAADASGGTTSAGASTTNEGVVSTTSSETSTET